MYDATRKSLIISALCVFGVAETITLILLKRLIYNYLQVALHRPSIEGSNWATRLPQRGLTALVLFFIGTLSQPLMLRTFLFNPPDPLSKGAIRAYGLSIAAGLSLPASSGPASEDPSQSPLTHFSSGHIRPPCAPERMAIASLFFGRHLRLPW